jgi:hypothetical protein
MSHCSSLCEDVAAAAEAENVEEITISAELEHAFGENPAASDGERYAARPNAEDDLGKGASDSANPQTCYFGSSTIMVKKSWRWKRGVISRRASVVHLGLRPCQSQTTMKLLSKRTSLSPACACLHILPWLIFFYIFKRSCIS